MSIVSCSQTFRESCAFYDGIQSDYRTPVLCTFEDHSDIQRIKCAVRNVFELENLYIGYCPQGRGYYVLTAGQRLGKPYVKAVRAFVEGWIYHRNGCDE